MIEPLRLPIRLRVKCCRHVDFAIETLHQCLPEHRCEPGIPITYYLGRHTKLTNDVIKEQLCCGMCICSSRYSQQCSVLWKTIYNSKNSVIATCSQWQACNIIHTHNLKRSRRHIMWVKKTNWFLCTGVTSLTYNTLLHKIGHIPFLTQPKESFAHLIVHLT